eukprot:GHUV01016247.1.p1 GENE.GHUV01016247.1~~GHUV01016247.1.p1  ORF type:complete len:113 (-),score=2.63 GHUV01016247.1:1810-2148(-)
MHSVGYRHNICRRMCHDVRPAADRSSKTVYSQQAQQCAGFPMLTCHHGKYMLHDNAVEGPLRKVIYNVLGLYNVRWLRNTHSNLAPQGSKQSMLVTIIVEHGVSVMADIRFQ